MRNAILAALAMAWLHAQDLGKAVYARDRTVDLQHVRLDVAFDLPARRVSGTATLRLAPLHDGLTEVTLDSVGLNVAAVTFAGRSLQFHRTTEELRISLGRAYSAGAPLELAIRYDARPRRGLYFGDRQVWSQGFPDDNHYWFPIYDFPNDKTSSEMIVRVPPGWEAVSNGRLVEVRNEGGARTFHWYQSKPHSTYLISLAAGEMERHEEPWRDLSLTYYVPKSHGAEVPVTFGRTRHALDFFATRIGPYPWDKLAQAVVEDNFFSGMENTGAITYWSQILIGRELAADLQAGGDLLIAHEIAHQWFGDLVSPEDFRHLWLSEGFATYFANLWGEQHLGPDYAAWELHRHARSIASVAQTQKYPIVRRPGERSDPTGLLVYQKGAWVLHMLRRQLGDELFWKAIRAWVRAYAYQNARTADFVRTVASATGRNPEWLFDQFVYAPGHPEFEVRWRYDGRVIVSVRQRARLFQVPVEIEIDGRRHTIHVAKEAEEFALTAEAPPKLVLFDPQQSLLKKVTFAKGEAEWIEQLQWAPRAINRIEAAVVLSEQRQTDPVIRALERAATSDSFYGVRVEAAQALRDAAALRRVLADPHADVRRAAVESLSGLRHSPETEAALLEVARRDPSWLARASALRALGRLRPARAFELLKPFLSIDSPREVVREAAIGALSPLTDSRVEGLLLEWSTTGRPAPVRVAALSALGPKVRSSSAARQRLREVLEDASFRVRQTAARALGESP